MGEAAVGVPVLLELATADRATGLFARAAITDEAGDLVTAVSLTASSFADWLYVAAWTPTLRGDFSVTYEVFQDALFTVPTEHEPAVDHILVRSAPLDTSLSRVLGHLGENVRDDVLGYDANNRPLSFRRRIFPDKATADASTPGGSGEGEVATIQGLATHFDPARWETLLRTVTP